MRTVKEIKSDIRETRAEMKAKGIKRVSCFNGGLHGETYSLNATMFRLETELKTRCSPKGGLNISEESTT